ncbi:MAG: CHAT domain-containing protein [Myxococcales bacterium]|nr:CHAT domain-containing protein [Myxococcales bacterium]
MGNRLRVQQGRPRSAVGAGALVRPEPTFLLEIHSFGPVLRVLAEESGQRGWQTVRSYVQHEIRPSEVERISGEISELLDLSNRRGEYSGASHAELVRLGQRLFDELFPSSVKSELRRTQLRTLHLLIDDGLVTIPWELLHDGDEFLGLRFAMGRLVRTERAVLGRPRQMEPTKPATMLVICDPRDDLIASYYEGVTIRDSFDDQQGQLRIDLKSDEVDSEFIKDHIRDYDLVHYAGHADLDRQRLQNSGWRLSDGRLTMDDIVRIAGGPAFPSMIFANACQSGQVPTLGVCEKAFGIYSMAHAFLLGGVEHYIGALWDIPDESSSQFALAFYRELLAGETIGESLRRARLALNEHYGAETVLWASYVLYGDPGHPYFRVPDPIVLEPSGKIDAAATRHAESARPAKVIPLRQAMRRKTRGATTYDAGLVGPTSEWYNAIGRLLSVLLPVLSILALLFVLMAVTAPDRGTHVIPVESGTYHPPIRHRLYDTGPIIVTPRTPRTPTQ